MQKNWYQSKAVWGSLGFGLFGILNVFFPSDIFTTITLAALAWSGYGFRDALK